jgi:hypothetical protein
MTRDPHPATGQLKWDPKAARWLGWSGRQWAPALYSLDPEALRRPTALDAQPGTDPERRARILTKAVTEELMRGATLHQQDAHFAVLGIKRPVSHGLHFVATVLTLGLWSTVWLVMAIARREDRVRLDVDRWGHVWGSEAAR